MFNKKYMVIFLALLIACTGVVFAADLDDSAADSTIITGNATTGISDVQEQIVTSEDNKIVKETKNLKEDPTTISVDNDNFDTYFTSAGFGSNVNDGDTFSFTGDVSRYNNTTYVVDKQVNILGNDYTITLNTTSGSYFGNETGSSFIFDNGANYSSVSNLNFYNTQVIVRNTSHIIFDNIDVTVSNQRIGQGIGTFSIRDGSSYITVENSAFSTTNNDNSSTLVLADVQHCTIDNNIITGVGEVGNLLYLTTYNIATIPTEDTNSYNIIRYNTLNGPSSSTPVCWALVLSGHNNTIFKNTINYVGTAITTQAINVVDVNNYDNQISENNTIANNTVNNGGSVIIVTNNTVANNTFTGTLKTGINSLIENNTITKKVTAQEGSSLYYNTIFDGVLINGLNVRLIENNVSKTVNITKNNVFIEHNHICGNVKLTSSFSNVTMQNNIFCGSFANSFTPAGTNNTHCTSGCTAITCGCHVLTSSHHNLKADGNDIIEITKDNVEEYFELWNEDGDPADANRGNAVESYLITPVARANQGKTYLLDQSAVNALGRGIISFSSFNITVLGNNNPTIRAHDFSVAAPITLANFTIRSMPDEYDEPGSVVLVWPYHYEENQATTGLVENVTFINQWAQKVTSNKEMVKILAANPYATQNFYDSAIIRNCTFNLSLVSDNIDWDNQARPYSIPIFIPEYTNLGNVTLENCNINIKEIDYEREYSTIWAIFNAKNNTKIINNTMYIQGEKYLYAIENTQSNSIIHDNNIIINGTHYTAGVYVTGTNMQNNSIENNNITLYSGYHNPGENGAEEDSGYAIVIEDRYYYGGKYKEGSGGNVYNNIIKNNNISIYGHNTYAIEHYGGKNTTIMGNNISAYGINPTCIALTGINVTIENNIIKSLAQTNVTGKTVDYFPAVSAGMLLQLSVNTTVNNNSFEVENATGIIINGYENAVIINNNVTTTDDYAITLLNTNKTNITENTLIARLLKGNTAVQNKGNDNIIENNQPSEDTPKDDTLIIYEPDDEYDIADGIYIYGELVSGEDELPVAGEDVTITITFSDQTQITNTVTTEEDGGFTCTIDGTDLIVGETTLEVTYAGNDNNNPTTETFTITITAASSKIETIVDVGIDSDYDYKYGKPIICTVGVYDTEYNNIRDGFVKIYNGDIVLKEINLKQSTGGFMTLGDAGTYNLVAKYEGTDKYAESIITIDEITIQSLETTININADTTQINSGEEITFTVTVTDEYGSKVNMGIVNVESEGITGTIDLSTANSLTMNITDAGTYTFTATYAGSTNYDESSTDSQLTIEVIANEQPKDYSLVVDTTQFTAGTNATITATIYYGNEYGQEVANISKGKVTFKVNGKTLKDANGKVIYAKVTDGVATIEGYAIPESWNNQTTIQAVYSGSGEVSKLSSEITTLTITPKELELTTEEVTATAGTTVNLTATLNDNTINTGKMVFKVNGKTVKDANGKVIYAKVVNGTVSVEYVLPESMKSGSYNLSAVFIANGYDRLEDTKTLLVS